MTTRRRTDPLQRLVAYVDQRTIDEIARRRRDGVMTGDVITAAIMMGARHLAPAPPTAADVQAATVRTMAAAPRAKHVMGFINNERRCKRCGQTDETGPCAGSK